MSVHFPAITVPLLSLIVWFGFPSVEAAARSSDCRLTQTALGTFFADFSLVTAVPDGSTCWERAPTYDLIQEALKEIFRLENSNHFCRLIFSSHGDVERYLGFDKGMVEDFLKESNAACLIQKFNEDGLIASMNRQWQILEIPNEDFSVNAYTSLNVTTLFIPSSRIADSRYLLGLLLHELAVSVDALGKISKPVEEGFIETIKTKYERVSEALGMDNKKLSSRAFFLSLHQVFSDVLAALRAEDFAAKVMGKQRDSHLELCTATEDFSSEIVENIESYSNGLIGTLQSMIEPETEDLNRIPFSFAFVDQLKTYDEMPDKEKTFPCELLSTFTPVLPGAPKALRDTSHHSGPRPAIGGRGT